MWAVLIRSRSAAAAAASSTRVLTPSVSSGSGATCTTTRCPPPTRSRTASVRYSSPWALTGWSRSSAGQSRSALEDVDRRVRLADRELLRRRVGRLDDRLEIAVAVANDAAVAADVGGHEREDGRARSPATMGLEQGPEQLAREQRRIAGEDQHLVGTGDRMLRAPHRVARPERLLLHRDVQPLELVRGVGRDDDDERRRRRAAGPPRRSSRPSGGRGSDAGASGSPRACVSPGLRPSRRLRAWGGIRTRSSRWLGRQDSNLGSRDQNPLPYHLATPQ